MSERFSSFQYYNLQDPALKTALEKAPLTIKILAESLLRYLEKKPEIVQEQHLEQLLDWKKSALIGAEIPFFPARVLLQDFSGIPLLVDMAGMRDTMKEWGGSAEKINPLKPMELVIDHSIIVDHYGSASSEEQNQKKDYERNQERYRFFKWAQSSLKNFTAVPPHTGIVHQVNIEYLARGVFAQKISEGTFEAYPDTAVGTDSHTTMMNGLGLLGWGVGGIEAEAAALDLPLFINVPYVLGVKLKGALNERVSATDLVLTITEILRKKGVVGKFVEFFGPGVASLSVTDRVTIANMSPEFGSTAALFPFDGKTLEYFKLTGRSEEHCNFIENYYKKQDMWFDAQRDIDFHDVIEIDLSEIVPSIAGPGRPQDRMNIDQAAEQLAPLFSRERRTSSEENLQSGDVVIAAITSCTNTSNPFVLLQAALLAKKAVEKGLKVPSWVKTSLAPGSQTVSLYLKNTGLMSFLETLGFHVVGYGCTTCIGNSGPLKREIEDLIETKNLNACAVLSGNRNFEGRIHPLVKSSFLASPTYVVAYALAGTMMINWEADPIGYDTENHPIFLKDIWPSIDEVQDLVKKAISASLYQNTYKNVFQGDQRWKDLKIDSSLIYPWEEKSSYLKRPPYLSDIPLPPPSLKPLKNAKVLAVFGHSVTTDHISPAGSISVSSPAGQYLIARGIVPEDFNSYGARRGHDEVMIRGTFANKRLKNLMVAPKEGGWTRKSGQEDIISIYDAAMSYQKEGIPLVILAGKEYGSGSSRDWAAKGTALMGVRCVIAQSYERIHRSNLIGMGVIPLAFSEGESIESLGLKGDESFDIEWNLAVRGNQVVDITFSDGRKKRISTMLRIESEEELLYLKHGGIIPYVLRKLYTQD